jgi:hypothetical protein
MKTEYKIRLEDGINGKGKTKTITSSKGHTDMYNIALNTAVETARKMFIHNFDEKIDSLKIQGNTKLTMFRIFINENLMVKVNIES